MPLNHIYTIIDELYNQNPRARNYLLTHSEKVREKAVEIAHFASDLNPDLQLIEEASLLHDIGIIKTHAPSIACSGEHPYIAHGIIGRQLLESYGLYAHALICERHIGVGLTKEEVLALNKDLPVRDMLPLSLEEKIVCVADNFYSKEDKWLLRPKPLSLILKNLERYGSDKTRRFLQLCKDIHFPVSTQDKI